MGWKPDVGLLGRRSDRSRTGGATSTSGRRRAPLASGVEQAQQQQTQKFSQTKRGRHPGALFVYRLSLEVVSVRAVKPALASGEHFLKFPA